jgi:glycerol-3-phosphate O-acyltransferase
MEFSQKVDGYLEKGKLPLLQAQRLKKFYQSYRQAIEASGKQMSAYLDLLCTFVDLVVKEDETPFAFEAFHERVKSPFDYYHFGLDFIRPLIDFERSSVRNQHHLNTISQQLQNKENVILLANHQIEPDPQVIHLLLEKSYPQLAEAMIFVAGHRVITDPLAVPFSMGCNLLCIFSKKYIEVPPEQKMQKQLHNQKTMKKMQLLLDEGGKCIYVAPSGGRDRANEAGVVEVAPFDPQSIEMFWLMSRHASRPTHFYPLALSTYDLLPPPSSEDGVGEVLHAQCTPVHLCFGDEVDMVNFPGSTPQDKRQNRQIRADYIHNLVKEDYRKLV